MAATLKTTRPKWPVSMILVSFLILLMTAFVSCRHQSSSSLDITSTTIKIHKHFYMDSPPHDTALYDTLHCSPNATHAQITKSYKALMRKYHPDKQRRQRDGDHSNSCNTMNVEKRFHEIQKAYEVLSQDSTRIHYHKYGMTDPTQALFLIFGRSPHSSSSQIVTVDDDLHRQLMLLLGYEPSTESCGDGTKHRQVKSITRNGSNDDDNNKDTKSYSLQDENAADVELKRRQAVIAAQLVEHMRPFVEGRIDIKIFSHQITTWCDELKTLPMGAHIIRCVGRAYRHSGQDFLLKYQHHHGGKKTRAHFHRQQVPDIEKVAEQFRAKPTEIHTSAFIHIRQRFRDARHFTSAAWAQGRAMLTQHQWETQQKRLEDIQKVKHHNDKNGSSEEGPDSILEYDDADSYLPVLINDNFDDDDNKKDKNFDEELKLLELTKAQETIMKAHYVEALWKVTKIQLDRIVRAACEMVLSGDHFFQPSHQQFPVSDQNCSPTSQDIGWVSSSSGIAIDANQARTVTAQAMVVMGDIMVKQSKKGTAWKGGMNEC